MAFTKTFILSLATVSTLTTATPLHTLEKDSALNPYQPTTATCASGSSSIRLSGPVSSQQLSPKESSYIASRKPFADQALLSWLSKQGFNLSSNTRIPSLALALGGGGPKASLLGAGVLQSLDSRDSSASTAGLLQALTYLSGLSGGSLTLGGVIGNDLEKVSTLRSTLWDTTFQDLLKRPIENLVPIVVDIAAKELAGSETTLLDVYARGLGYDIIGGSDGAAGVTFSGVSETASFRGYEMPFPLVQSTAADFGAGMCRTGTNGPLWEFSPYEFGSWEEGVQGFVDTRVLGTTFEGGKVKADAGILGLGIGGSEGKCVEGFDNFGWVIGTSANILATNMTTDCPFQVNGTNSSSPFLTPEVVEALQDLNIGQEFYGIVPNPFKGLSSASKVTQEDKLYLIDGGYSGLPIPYWSFLQPARSVDVIIAADFASDTPHNTTSGVSLQNTLSMAHAYNITRMPPVPTLAQVTAQNLTSHARFFGCGGNDTALLIWLPDTYATRYTGSELSFPSEGIDFLVEAGNRESTQDGDEEWAGCLACGILQRAGAVSGGERCRGCLEKYCWTG